MDKIYTELIMKLDYVNEDDIRKLISLIEKTDVKVKKIGIDEFSLTIEK